MNNQIYIAGLGVISAIGNALGENLQSLQMGKTGIGPMQRLRSVHHLPVAEVKMEDAELCKITGLPSHTSRTALLSTIAAKEAITNANIDIAKWRTGFISATSVGGMDKTENFYARFIRDKNDGDLDDVVHHECGAVTEITASALGIKDFVTTISTACSSSANSILLGARLIQQGVLDIVIAGGADALTRFTLNGFNTLMILDQKYCQPFDENRRGLNLGEGAGYVVMISQRVVDDLGITPLCVITGWCNANDAYHQTASSPDGTGSYLAMNGALEKSGLTPDGIDYINLHGTGTPNNDIAEGTAIQRIFADPYPLMSSTKSFTGHTLGASGGIEAVYSALAIMEGLVFPNLRFQTQMKELPFAPVTTLVKKKVRHVMSNSFGFGGNCTSLIFSKI